MSDEPPTRAPGRPGPYIVVGVLLAIGIAVPLIVPVYAHAEPTLIGLPFFYWYQMLWVFLDAGLLWICYGIVRREDRRRRDALRAPGAARGDRR
ncbi:MAG TPA: DUF3311 domain-containing protein [Amnibacterium sp.]|jgi:uncharacterized BrkB/YihY/UPF0761 family membrane protein|nr:DUF3311 domain-containing protein [Amnibacterium sp.]